MVSGICLQNYSLSEVMKEWIELNSSVLGKALRGRKLSSCKKITRIAHLAWSQAYGTWWIIAEMINIAETCHVLLFSVMYYMAWIKLCYWF
jgi:hypothetical protein